MKSRNTLSREYKTRNVIDITQYNSRKSRTRDMHIQGQQKADALLRVDSTFFHSCLLFKYASELMMLVVCSFLLYSNDSKAAVLHKHPQKL